MPESLDARIFYPSIPAVTIVEAFGVSDCTVSSAVVDLDGLDSVSSCALCGANCPTTAQPS